MWVKAQSFRAQSFHVLQKRRITVDTHVVQW